MKWKAFFLRVAVNGKACWKTFVKVWGTIAAVLGVLFVFVDWETLGIGSLHCKLLIFLGLTAGAAAISIGHVCNMNEKTVLDSGMHQVLVQYGDIMKISRPEYGTDRRIVVIPVNRCFDMTTSNNLVTPNSIHGKWLTQYVKKEALQKKLMRYIEKELSDHPCVKVSCRCKPNGNLNRYSPGTIVEVPGQGGVTFYLLALATYKNDLEVTCSEREFYEVVQSLIDYHKLHGQGNDLYCPIMCDHIVQPSKDSSAMLELILAIMKYNKQNIHGRIHVVVYDKKREEIPIALF